jgi:hypothetical protein
MLYFNKAGILLCFSLITISVYSQKVFIGGFIVKNNGENQEGLINYESHKRTPSKCIFKKFEIAKEVSYSPEDIAAFGFTNGPRYESVIIKGRKKFLEVLVKGQLSLYRNGSDFYLRSDNENIVLLSKGIISWKDGNSNKTFRGTDELLGYLGAGQVEVRSDNKSKNDLVPIISEINRSKDAAYNVYGHELKIPEIQFHEGQYFDSKSHYGLMAGINVYSLVMKYVQSDFIPQTGAASSVMAGFSFEKPISLRNERLALRTDMILFKQSLYSYKEQKLVFDMITRNDVFIDFTTLKIPILLQYNLNGKDFIPYFNFGISSMFFLNKKYLQISEKETHDFVYISENSSLVYKPAEMSFAIGSGIKRRLMSDIFLNLEGRVEAGLGIFRQNDEENQFKEHSFQVSFMVGLTF